RPSGVKRMFPFQPPDARRTSRDIPTVEQPFVQCSFLGSETISLPWENNLTKKRYELLRKIEHANPEIEEFVAQDKQKGIQVRLLRIHYFGQRSSYLKTFLMEVRTLCRKSHPNLRTVYDVGMADLTHYITSESIPGTPLRNYLAQKGKVEIDEALRLFKQCASVLAELQRDGLVYHFCGLDSLFVTQEGVLKMDFAVPRFFRPNVHGDSISLEYQAMRTPQFKEDEFTNPREDVYALGILFFKLIVGKFPHEVLDINSSDQLSQLKMGGRLPAISNYVSTIPAEWDQFYFNCINTDPSSGYQKVPDIIEYINLLSR
ncbi:MAG: protein kinase, partial [Candidatus Sumerlaeia bacterium]|nr:protein kinase [Candidatus Sumerlaeia bacterium]